MRAEHADLIVQTFMTLIAERLTEAASLAKAAEACVNAGNRDGAAHIANDIDSPLFEAQNLINAASLVNRLAREAREAD